MFDSIDEAQTLDVPETKRIQLSDGFTVSEEFYDQSVAWIAGRLHELAREGEDLTDERGYPVKKIAGTAYWAQLSNGDRSLFGRCIAHAVLHGLLPLEFVEHAHEYPKRYRRK
jgi:hypothetical protein